jgi:ankyrin repeat protein
MAANKDNSREMFLNACEYGDLEYVKIALSEGFNPSFGEDYEYLEPIHIACGVGGYIDIVIELLNYGANIEGCSKGHYRPLSVAIDYGNHDIIKELVERGADVDAIDHIDSYELLEDEKGLVLNLLGKNRNIKPAKR